jgi:UDP-2-acetamido-2,6-beta-L-arabino-hexul-4-ose reductase
VTHKNILITGSSGFIGKNLVAHLQTRNDVVLSLFDIDDDDVILCERLAEADIIFHLAGVNRPVKVEEFQTGNTGLTQTIVNHLLQLKRNPTIVISSSIQAEFENPYGVSKRMAEESLREYAIKTNASVYIYRLPNVFGKWCRPNYNSVVATFCNNIAHDQPISISDPGRELELIYVDDVVKDFLSVLDRTPCITATEVSVVPTYKITLGALAETIRNFRTMRQTLFVDSMNDRLLRTLYITYLSYLEKDDFSYKLETKSDNRGNLAEMFKSETFGQIFISRTKPGITRGNHYHHAKTEKFCVIEGNAVIRFRHILGKEIISYPVSGKDLTIVDIPPGYTHSIENTGEVELTTLFWASEPFDTNSPDTYFESVL